MNPTFTARTKRTFCMLCIIGWLLPTSYTWEAVHPAFSSWLDYRTYFAGMRYHSGWHRVFYAYKENGQWFFINKKGAGMSDEKELKDFDYANGWLDTPTLVTECSKLKHQLYYETVGRCVTEYSCPICGYKYRVDSSD